MIRTSTYYGPIFLALMYINFNAAQDDLQYCIIRKLCNERKLSYCLLYLGMIIMDAFRNVIWNLLPFANDLACSKWSILLAEAERWQISNHLEQSI